MHFYIYTYTHARFGQTAQETFDIWRPTLTQIFIVCLYYAVGIMFYYHKEGWSFVECCFFITQTITTVGYGYQYPTSAGFIHTHTYSYAFIRSHTLSYALIYTNVYIAMHIHTYSCILTQ